MSKDYINQKFKATIFEMIFRETEAALSLYNAINDTNYTDASQLEITTLNNALYMGMKNDVSFIIDFVMNLYEHQSTYNPNMPLRGLFYFARLYEAYIKEKGLDIFSSARIPLPSPQYIVFYNGERNLPEKTVLHLTDSFSPDGAENHLEVTTIMYNINTGNNTEIMKKCRFLKEYTDFIDTIRKYRKMGYTYEHSVKISVDECIAANTLREFLIHNKAGVLKMILSEYDEKLHIENEKRIAVEQAKEEWEREMTSALKQVLQSEKESQRRFEEERLRARNAEKLLAQTSAALEEALAEIKRLKEER